MAKHRTHSIELKRQVAQESWPARPFMGSPNDTPSAVTDPGLGSKVRGRRL